jgi:uncharacterized membrane protein YhaH (DUF805 family)
VAGVAVAVGGEIRRARFWLGQLAHQAPMAVSMILMATVLRSSMGVLAIVAGLWIVALARARAARTSRAAREFLADLLAMALVLVVPLLHGTGQLWSGAQSGAESAVTAGAMPGMPALAFGAASAAIVVGVWALARFGLFLAPAAPDARVGSLVSGSCCALGLVAMALM